MGPKKSSGSAAAKAAAAPSSGAMPKGDVSRMLGYLKYHARAGNKNHDDMSEARTALEKYNACEAGTKSAFLSMFEANKGSLKWVHSFAKVTKEEEVNEATS